MHISRRLGIPVYEALEQGLAALLEDINAHVHC